MIPTRYKSKLPRNLSYPIGAEALSEGLAGAPRAELLTVIFSDRPVYRASEFRRLLNEQVPYPIVVAAFHPATKPGFTGSQHMVETGLYDEKWEITVYPVINQLRHPANRLLREEGLMSLLEWLQASQAPNWTSRPHRCELVFSPIERSIAVRQASDV